MPTRIKPFRTLARLVVFCSVVLSLFFPTTIPAQTTSMDDNSADFVHALQGVIRQTGSSSSSGQPSVSPVTGITTLRAQVRLPGVSVSTPVTPVCSPNALVVLSTPNQAELETIIIALQRVDGCALHIFPPHAFIGFVPLLARPVMLQLSGVEAIYTSRVDLGTLAGQSQEMKTAAYAWNHNFVDPQPAKLPGPNALPLVADQRMVDPALVELKPDNGLLSPGYYEVSEFMVGTVAVGIILPESTGAIDPSTENWTLARMSDVVAEIQAAMGWWNSQNPNGNLSFVYDIHYLVPTSYEPINRPSGDDGLWVSETLTTLGYPGSNWYTQIHDYLNAIRSANHTDWAAVAYVVDSLNDPDGMFTDGYFGYSYGSLIVMTYDNDGWGIENMDSVTAHEFAHNFGAGDEYCSPGYACCYGGGQYGYLGVPNSNCEAGCDHNGNGVCDGDDSTPGSNCHDCPTCVEVNCLMRNGSVVYGLDVPSQQHVGIRDSDGDGILDPADTTPDVTLYPYLPDPTADDTPTWMGDTQDIPWDSPIQADVTINFLIDVSFRIDAGPWGACSADDGSFDETEENFSCTPAPLSDGTHTIEVYATNRVGNMSAIASDTLTIETFDPPGDFDKINPADGASDISTSPTLSWEASSDVVNYEYCLDTVTGSTCDTFWVSTGTATSLNLSGLPAGTTFYWQARAHNAYGDTYANDGAWWSFTTLPPPPDHFDKLAPADTASDVPTDLILTWQASSRAGRYEYCYDEILNAACDSIWTNTGNSTSVAISGLSFSTQFEWQVRAVNAGGETYANDGTGWSFTTLPLPPDQFDKLAPANTVSDVPTDLILFWQASSRAGRYEYCYDATLNAACDSIWTNTGTSTSAALTGLSNSTQYEWQVRALNAGGGMHANDGTWWSFTTRSAVANIYLPVIAR